MDKRQQINFGYLLMAILLTLLLQQWLFSMLTEARTVPFSEFKRLLEQGKIEEVVITDDYITARLKDGQGFRQNIVVTAKVDPEMARFFDRYHVRYARAVESKWLETLISWLAPSLIFFGIWLLLIRRLAERQGGFVQLGKSRAKVYVEKKTGVRFSDVAGCEEAKEELKEVVEFLKNPRHWGRLGARIPKGVLLVGPPGTGKTLLAKAVAGEADVPFFSISGSEFVEMFVGVGAARVRDLFEQAKKAAPAIIFIDELDALGRARTIGAPISNDEREQTLNQLLVEMDGFDSSTGVVVLAATNRPEILDPALLRAGRFDRQIVVDRPDKAGRVAILRVHLRKIRAAEDLDLDKIAALTAGFSGADLENLVNEAAILATRRGAEAVEMQDFVQAIERVVAGSERKSRVLGERERLVVAHHELGHAFVALAIPGAEPVQKVSIIPRGVGALGYTIQRPSEDRYLYTRKELEAKIAVLLGGRAAEEIFFGEASTGAADDLAKATDLAREIIARYGMDESIGLVVVERPRNAFLAPSIEMPASEPVSEALRQRIDAAVRKVLDEQFARAKRILTRNRALIEEAAQALLQKETLDEDDIRHYASRLEKEQGDG